MHSQRVGKANLTVGVPPGSVAGAEVLQAFDRLDQASGHILSPVDGWPMAIIFTRFRGLPRSVSAFGCDFPRWSPLEGCLWFVLQSSRLRFLL